MNMSALGEQVSAGFAAMDKGYLMTEGESVFNKVATHKLSSAENEQVHDFILTYD